MFFSMLLGGNRRAGTDLFTVVTNDRTQWNSLKQSQGGLGCTSGERFLPRAWLDTGTGSQGSSLGTKPDSSQNIWTTL